MKALASLYAVFFFFGGIIRFEKVLIFNTTASLGDKVAGAVIVLVGWTIIVGAGLLLLNEIDQRRSL